MENEPVIPAEVQFTRVSREFQVVEERLDWLRGQVSRLQRRAAKLGVEPVRLEVGACSDTEDGGRMVRRFAVTISGVTPKVNGWTFAATIQHLAGGENIVRNCCTVDAPEKYRAVASDCEHCGTRRRRNDTYLVISDEDEWKQVGSSCLKDFTGHTDPEKLAALAEMLGEALEAARSGGTGTGAGPNRYPIVRFLAHAAEVMKCNSAGFLGRGKARQMGDVFRSTADQAWRLVDHGSCSSNFAPEPPSAKALEVAQAAYEWCLGIGENDGDLVSEFEHNIRAVARTGLVEGRTAGYAAAIVYGHLREQERREEASRPSTVSEHVGQVGERLRAVKVRVDRVADIEREDGVLHLHTLLDAGGRVYKWFTQSERLEPGSEHLVDMTVKRHGEYRGAKETVVNRVAPAKAPKAKRAARQA